jgi:hypothetical protein
MQIQNTQLEIGLVTALVSSCCFFLVAVLHKTIRNGCESDSLKYEHSKFHDQFLRNCWIGYLLGIIAVCAGTYLFVVARSQPNLPWFIFIFAMMCIIAGIVMAPLTMTSGILIKNDDVILVTLGRQRPLFRLSDITNVSVNGMCFEVRTKTDAGKRIIPLVCRNNALLLAMLRHYRPAMQQTNDA